MWSQIFSSPIHKVPNKTHEMLGCMYGSFTYKDKKRNTDSTDNLDTPFAYVITAVPLPYTVRQCIIHFTP